MFTRYPGYTDSDMYLHIKGIMIENIFEYQKFSEWKGCVRDYAVYLADILQYYEQGKAEYYQINKDALDFLVLNCVRIRCSLARVIPT